MWFIFDLLRASYTFKMFSLLSPPFRSQPLALSYQEILSVSQIRLKKVIKKPSRPSLYTTTGARDTLHALPPYFYPYLTIRTSWGSNKPSPVTGLTVPSYFSPSNFRRPAREGCMLQNRAGSHQPPALWSGLTGTLDSFIAFHIGIIRFILLYQSGISMSTLFFNNFI